MKKGDKFVSKRTIKELDFHRGQTYTYYSQLGNLLYFTLLGKSKIIPFGVSENEIYDYFHTEKELRKLKLENIEKNENE